LFSTCGKDLGNEGACAGRFTLKFTVNFKYFFQFKKIHGQFQIFFANNGVRAACAPLDQHLHWQQQISPFCTRWLKGSLVNCLEHFFRLFFCFANKVSSTVCNVSNFVLTPWLHKCGFCHFYARKALTPLIWRERSTAEFPMMSFLSISFSASGRAFILTGAYNKMSSSETERTAYDMSDLSYEQELGELVKVVKSTKAPCNTVKN
jgi:hypothetical protein